MFPTVFLPFPWLLQYATCSLSANVYISIPFLIDPFLPGQIHLFLCYGQVFSLFEPFTGPLLVLSMATWPTLIKILP